MKILTKEEERAHYNATLQGGAIGGFAGLAAGVAGVYGASLRFPAFRSLTLPFRTFLIISTGTFASIISADSASRRYEDQRNPERKYVDESASLQEQIDAQKSSKQKTMEWLGKNRYSIVFGSWVASMGAAFYLVNRDRYLTTAQKIVQARVYAQGFTLAAVIISLAFEGGDRLSSTGRWETVKILDPDDPTHKRMIEKKIHHERYQGEDQWMDMVEAEERRMKERERQRKAQAETNKDQDGRKAVSENESSEGEQKSKSESKSKDDAEKADPAGEKQTSQVNKKSQQEIAKSEQMKGGR